DLEQPLAIQSGGERLDDAPHRSINLDLLPLELLHLRPEAVAHLVDLAREPGHLVAAHDRLLLAEVAVTEPPGRLEHRADLPAQHPEERQDEEKRDDEEQDQRSDHEWAR